NAHRRSLSVSSASSRRRPRSSVRIPGAPWTLRSRSSPRSGVDDLTAPEVLWDAPVGQKPVDTEVQVHGSKSLTARWTLLAATADEPPRLRGALVSRDTRLMADALERLGATLRFEDAELQDTPLPLPSQRPAEPIEIDTGLA